VSTGEDFKPSPLVENELDRVNRVWQNLVENIQKKPNKDRVKAILVQVMMEHYIDRILIINEVDLPEEIYKMRYDTTLEKLKSLSLIDKDLEHDLLNVYKIRNIYAHEIEIHENQVLDLVNSVKTIRNPTRFSEDERVDMIAQIILRQVQRIFMEILVREQEKSERNNPPRFQSNSSSHTSLQYCKQHFWLL